ncbi:hypothetical protein MMC09_002864 [Bachmanniomyces sp. S44760]|nr:hypothetical protein [Bachmanniomyces sp. S44760]
MISNIVFFFLVILNLISSLRATIPSPQASVDLICHTKHESECYPRIFQPTKFFQTVNDDQELIPGLHIRMNLQTGKKEAKLNEIEDDESEHIAELAVIQSTEDGEVTDEAGTVDEAIPPELINQLVYQAAHGPIRTPLSEPGDKASYTSSQVKLLSTQSSDSTTILPALENLEDLSHDIYWGHTLLKDGPTVHKVIGLLSANITNAQVRGAAALLLGTAIQNNPQALSAALGHCYNDNTPQGPLEAVIVALVQEQLPQLLTRFVYLLSALCQDQAQLVKFIDLGGLDLLKNVFDADNMGLDDTDRLRGKIANFILDYMVPAEPKIMPSVMMSSKELKEISGDQEIDSNLQSEDPWILADAEGDHVGDSVPHDAEAPDGSDRVSHTLRPWKDAFLMSQEQCRGDSRECDPIALENIVMAYEALKLRLVPSKR